MTTQLDEHYQMLRNHTEWMWESAPIKVNTLTIHSISCVCACCLKVDRRLRVFSTFIKQDLVFDPKWDGKH